MTTSRNGPASAQEVSPGNTETPRHGLPLRVGAVFVGAAAIWLLIVYVNIVLLIDNDSLAVRLMNAALASILGVALVVVARRHLDRRRFDGLGLTTTRKAWIPFVVGVAAFALPSLVGLGIATLAGWVQLSLAVSASDLLASMAVLIVTVFLYEALPEELIFRGYLYRNLSEAAPPWLAALGQAVLFAVFGTALWVLTSGWGVLVERATIFLFMAIVLGFIRIVSASVWTCIGFHWAFQLTAQTLLGPNIEARGPVELFGIVPAFALGVAIVTLMLRRGHSNWTQPEPDSI